MTQDECQKGAAHPGGWPVSTVPARCGVTHPRCCFATRGDDARLSHNRNRSLPLCPQPCALPHPTHNPCLSPLTPDFRTTPHQQHPHPTKQLRGVESLRVPGRSAEDSSKGFDTYCLITAGRQQHRSRTIEHTAGPQWNEVCDIHIGTPTLVRAANGVGVGRGVCSSRNKRGTCVSALNTDTHKQSNSPTHTLTTPPPP